MFEFMDMLNFGKELEVNGEKWLSIKSLQNRCHLVVRPTDTYPCQVFLVQTLEVLKEGKGAAS